MLYFHKIVIANKDFRNYLKKFPEIAWMENGFENSVWLAFMHYKEVEKWVPTVVIAEEAVSPLVPSLEEKSFSHWKTIKKKRFSKQVSESQLTDQIIPHNPSFIKVLRGGS